MPVIKAFDLAYGRLRSPDLDKQEEFLTAFYAAQRQRLEQRMVLGQRRERKRDAADAPTRTR